VHDVDAIAKSAQRAPGAGNRSRIAIKPNQPRRTALEQRARVPPEADRAVDKQTAARGLEMFEHFGDHDGLVQRVNAQGSMRNAQYPTR
jgi:hypothetical protein